MEVKRDPVEEPQYTQTDFWSSLDDTPNSTTRLQLHFPRGFSQQQDIKVL